MRTLPFPETALEESGPAGTGAGIYTGGYLDLNDPFYIYNIHNRTGGPFLAPVRFFSFTAQWYPVGFSPGVLSPLPLCKEEFPLSR